MFTDSSTLSFFSMSGHDGSFLEENLIPGNNRWPQLPPFHFRRTKECRKWQRCQHYAMANDMTMMSATFSGV